MLGAIIGDIVGSKYEFNNVRCEDFELMGQGCDYVDDTIGAIVGGLAEAFCGIPEALSAKALTFLPDDMQKVVDEFYWMS